MRKKTQSKAIFKELLNFIIPGITGLLFNSLYIVVDGIFVARMLGREALAAVTVGVPAVEILLALSMLVAVGAGVIISSEHGKGNLKEARQVFNLSVRTLLALSIFIAITSLIFIKPLAKLMGATPDIMDLVVEYLLYFLLFSPAFMFSYAMSAWLRNDSQPKLAMTAQIIGALANVFLDWFFMGPLQMGVGGAALATGLGPIIGIAIMLPHFVKKTGNLYFESTPMNKSLLVDMIKKGIPSFTMEFALGITTLCVNIAISIHMGALEFATFGIIGYIALIVLSIFLGMAEGSQPLISYYHGANQTHKTNQILKMSLGLSIVFGILSYIFLYYFIEIPVTIFAQHDLELIQSASTAALYYFWAFFVSGINILLASYVQSIGRWPGSILISLNRSLIILMPLLLVLPYLFGGIGIWISVPLAEVLTAPISYVTYSRQRLKLAS